MQVHIERQKKTISITFQGTVKQLLKKIQQNPETVLVAVNDSLVTEDCKLKNKDDVKILSVISGG